MMRLVIILIVLLLISFRLINSQSQGRNNPPLPLLTKLGQRINDVNQGDAGCIALTIPRLSTV